MIWSLQRYGSVLGHSTITWFIHVNRAGIAWSLQPTCFQASASNTAKLHLSGFEKYQKEKKQASNLTMEI